MMDRMVGMMDRMTGGRVAHARQGTDAWCRHDGRRSDDGDGPWAGGVDATRPGTRRPRMNMGGQWAVVYASTAGHGAA